MEEEKTLEDRKYDIQIKILYIAIIILVLLIIICLIMYLNNLGIKTQTNKFYIDKPETMQSGESTFSPSRHDIFIPEGYGDMAKRYDLPFLEPIFTNIQTYDSKDSEPNSIVSQIANGSTKKNVALAFAT